MAFGLPSLSNPLTNTPAQVLPFMRDPKVAGSGKEAVNKSLGETETPWTSTFSFLSKPSLFIVFKMSMNSFPRPYLKLTFLASIF